MSDHNSTADSEDASSIVERLEAGAGAGHDPNFLPVETERALDHQDDDQSVAEIVERLEAGAGAGHDPNFLPLETERALDHPQQP